MPQFPFSRLQDTARASVEARHECADMARRARFELAETRAASRRTIAESRNLTAEADAVPARRNASETRRCQSHRGSFCA
jgi:hypothetical protein